MQLFATKTTFIALISLLLLMNADVIMADSQQTSVPATTLPQSQSDPVESSSVRIHGYGDIQMSYHDFSLALDPQGVSFEEHRGVFDLHRFTLEIESTLPYDVEFEAEIEFEHGGTGASLELEYEEFGEYNVDIETGGAVLLEKLYLKKTINDFISMKLGRFPVGLGLLSYRYHPTEYLGALVSESENTLLPSSWNELGLETKIALPHVQLTLQVVNGLDSTGFSAQQFIARGHQARFEKIRATNLAFVSRLDVPSVLNKIDLGSAIYVSPSTRHNRPKPDLNSNVNAPLVLLSAYATIQDDTWHGALSGVYGHLWDAEIITKHNRSLSNNLDAPRTEVASDALAVWGEFGFDLLSLSDVTTNQKLIPFIRLEYYDTMLRVDETIFDNPRYSRTIAAAGINYTLDNALTFKLEYMQRRLALFTDQSSNFRPETTISFSPGFVF